ncbi:DUF3105 domain-containing protein [Candidatus Daviesbacteria bacterium]|nr:DUF3105 domain-containing protein [Candidatus Daviesbacteria bacterium]
MIKRLVIFLIILTIIGIISWAWLQSTKPLPGTQTEDQGRDHIKDQSQQVSYKTNPPTSGPHFENWLRAGIYEVAPDDRYVVHSLEHGYVMISYNCSFSQRGFLNVYAHGLEEEATDSAEATSSAILPTEFRSDDCHQLVDQLISIFERKGKRKLIITPRSNLDSRIALTAWRRIDKFNDLDTKRIEKFIDELRDHGPEKTME